MTEIFSVSKEYPAGPLETFFYKTWSGYSHPVRLRKPVSYYAAILGTTYYEAGFTGEDSDLLLVRVEKKLLKKTNLPVDTYLYEGHRFFEAISGYDGEVSIGPEVSALHTIEMDKFIYAYFSTPNSSTTQFIEKQVPYSYEYEYDKGRLVKARIIGASGVNELKF